jgi:aryl-alcohol dehydrogenase
MKITAAVVTARSAPFEIETLDLAAPLADEVLVRVVASGLCHTDLHARDGYFPNLPYPVVCGHEGAGVVEQVGAAVTELAPGDPVVISFPWCGECGPCLAERIAYCECARPLKSSGRRADGSIPMSRNGEPVYSCFFQQSSFASFALAPAKDVVKLHDTQHRTGTGLHATAEGTEYFDRCVAADHRRRHFGNRDKARAAVTSVTAAPVMAERGAGACRED